MKRGPIARPSVYNVKGRIASSRETEKTCCIRGLAGTVTDEAKVLSSTPLVCLLIIDFDRLTFRKQGAKEGSCGRFYLAYSNSWGFSSRVDHSSPGASPDLSLCH